MLQSYRMNCQSVYEVQTWIQTQMPSKGYQPRLLLRIVEGDGPPMRMDTTACCTIVSHICVYTLDYSRQVPMQQFMWQPNMLQVAKFLDAGMKRLQTVDPNEGSNI